MNPSTILAAALCYRAAGLSCIPATLPDKQPYFTLLPTDEHTHTKTWNVYTKAIADERTIRHWFSQQGAVPALVCGAVSGGLEILDFDNKGAPNAQDLYIQWVKLVHADAPGLIYQLPLEQSRSGGYHLFYRCSTIEGSQKLAQRPPTAEELAIEPKAKAVTLIETRGERLDKDGTPHCGYCVVSPTPGYKLLRGDLNAIPTITEAERAILIRAGQVLNRVVPAPQLIQEPRTPANVVGLRPGDDYNARVSAEEIVALLEKAGWHKTPNRAHGIATWWRPGKTQGSISATLGYVNPNVLFVFSSNAAPFKADRPYDPFQIFANLNHAGDFSAAARELAQQGYGDQSWRAVSSQNAQNTQNQAQTNNSANSANSANALQGLAQWDPPIPFNHYDCPAFPIAALPPWLRALVEAISVAMQTPPDLAALLALGILATTLQKKVDILIRNGWREPTNLFLLVALAPGNRKSAVFRMMMIPLFEWERAEAERIAPEIAAAHAKSKIIEERQRLAQMEAAKGASGQLAAKQDEALKLAQELDAMKIPVAPRLIADDITPEQLASLICEHDGRMSIMSAEGGIVDIMAGRYSNGAPNIDVYLKGHAGDELRVDRRSRKAELVQSPALTVALTVQPEVLRGLTGHPGFRGRGLLGRFLYAVPASLLGHRKINAPSVPQSIEVAYHQHIMALLALPFGTNDAGYPAAHTLNLSPAARDQLLAFETWVEPQLRDLGELGMMTDWGGKLVGAVARIAALLHMAAHCMSHAPWSLTIESATIEAAVSIGKYLIPHARAAYAEMGTDEQIAAAQYLLRWIESQGIASFTKREAFEGTKGTFKKTARLEPALTLLELYGYIRRQPVPQHPGPGRPSEGYEVNPMIASQYSQYSQNCQFPEATTAVGDDFANSANSAKAAPTQESNDKGIQSSLEVQVNAMHQASRAWSLIGNGLFDLASVIIEQMPDSAIDKLQLQMSIKAQCQPPFLDREPSSEQMKTTGEGDQRRHDAAGAYAACQAIKEHNYILAHNYVQFIVDTDLRKQMEAEIADAEAQGLEVKE